MKLTYRPYQEKRFAPRLIPALLPAFFLLFSGCRGAPSQQAFVDISRPAGVGNELPAWDVLATDIDRDGRMEILLASHSHAAWFELRGNTLAPDPLSPWQVVDGADRHGMASCDLDGDGQDELVVNTGGAGGKGGEPTEVWTLSAAGTWSDVGASVFPGTADLRGRAVACADIDGDGRMEVHLSVEDGPDRLLRPAGAEGPELPTFTDGSSLALWADLNGDALPDLVRVVEERLEVQLQQAGGTLGAPVRPAGLGQIGAVALADLDGDGDLDLYAGVTAGPGRGDLVAAGRLRLRFRGADSDRVTWSLPRGCNEVTLRARGRLDGTRAQITTSSARRRNEVVLVRGHASRPDLDDPLSAWIEKSSLVVHAQAEKGVVEVGIRCRDGRAPAVATAEVETRVSRPSLADGLLWNRGDGSFRVDFEALGDTSGWDTVDVKPIDFDGDGDTDLFVVRGRRPGTLESSPDLLLENLGDGRFSPSPLFRDVRPTGIAGLALWVDLTGDGAPDLLQLPSEYGGPLGAAPRAWENPY